MINNNNLVTLRMYQSLLITILGYSERLNLSFTGEAYEYHDTVQHILDTLEEEVALNSMGMGTGAADDFDDEEIEHLISNLRNWYVIDARDELCETYELLYQQHQLLIEQHQELFESRIPRYLWLESSKLVNVVSEIQDALQYLDRVNCWILTNQLFNIDTSDIMDDNGLNDQENPKDNVTPLFKEL